MCCALFEFVMLNVIVFGDDECAWFVICKMPSFHICIFYNPNVCNLPYVCAFSTLAVDLVPKVDNACL